MREKGLPAYNGNRTECHRLIKSRIGRSYSRNIGPEKQVPKKKSPWWETKREKLSIDERENRRRKKRGPVRGADVWPRGRRRQQKRDHGSDLAQGNGLEPTRDEARVETKQVVEQRLRDTL